MRHRIPLHEQHLLHHIASKIVELTRQKHSFAAKEATMKALGTGIRGVGWKDIEVVRHESGAPAIKLHQRGETRAQRRGVQEISLSLSHSREYAVAFVVIRSESPG